MIERIKEFLGLHWTTVESRHVYMAEKIGNNTRLQFGTAVVKRNKETGEHEIDLAFDLGDQTIPGITPDELPPVLEGEKTFFGGTTSITDIEYLKTKYGIEDDAENP